MFGSSEFKQTPGQTGTVAINTEYYREKRPLWLITLKLLGVAAMVAVGAAIAVPTLLELELPLWMVIAYTVGGMAVYVGIAFFVRPEPDTDNLSTDQFSRWLWKAHCVLGPGRFTSETFLDVLTFAGLIRSDNGEEAAQTGTQSFASYAASGSSSGRGFDATQPIAPLDPNRFALSSAGSVTEKIMRDSQRYTVGEPPAPAR